MTQCEDRALTLTHLLSQQQQHSHSRLQYFTARVCAVNCASDALITCGSWKYSPPESDTLSLKLTLSHCSKSTSLLTWKQAANVSGFDSNSSSLTLKPYISQAA